MRYLEMSGATLFSLLLPDEYPVDDLRKAGVTEQSRVRVNWEGDFEVLLDGEWEVMGGLLGDFLHRIEDRTGIKWTDGS